MTATGCTTSRAMPTAPIWRRSIGILKPDMLIPMHGEHRHLREHAKLAEARGIASEVATNGMMIDLTGDQPEVAEYIETGRALSRRNGAGRRYGRGGA